MKSLITVIVVLMIQGCANTTTASAPLSYNAITANHSYGRISSTIVHTNQGSYQLIRNGSTNTVTRISK
jgi:hypothetical protein